MYQTMTLEQLVTCSTKELKAYKTKAQARKNELEALKAKGGDTWTNNLQEELNDIAVYLVDIDDALQGQKKNVYKPAAGTENLVHVKWCEAADLIRALAKKNLSRMCKCLLFQNGYYLKLIIRA